MSQRKILVTGGAGFIGSHTVVELIASGWTPIIVDNFCNSSPEVIDGIEQICGTRPEVYDVDCTDYKKFREVFETHSDVFGVIHFAAYKAVGESVSQPLKYYHNNINSLLTLLELMTAYNIKNHVFSSSCTVYGQPDHLPVDENFPVQKASSPYGFTKQVCEQLCLDASRQDQNKVASVMLRYFNPIGAHPSGLIGELPLGIPNNLIPFITQTAAGLRNRLVVFGDDYNTPDGTCVRDYIHVVDLAKAHVSALEWIGNQGMVCEAFNLGTGSGNSVMEVINTFQSVTGQKLNFEIGPRRAGDVEQIFASPVKAKNELGWETELSLNEALRDAWKWQQKLKTEA